MASLISIPTGIMLAALLVCAIGVGGCVGDSDDRRILVFAASSLTDALEELVDEYQSQTGVEVRVSFGSSNSLARQIVAGAPADVFVAAGSTPVDPLIAQGLVDSAGVREILGNELVLVTRPEGPAIDRLGRLSSVEMARLAIVNPDLGPAGAYSEQALRSVGLWEALRDKMVLTKDVRVALAYVVSGNADVAFVYRTDAVTEPGLNVALAVPPELHSPIVYFGVALADSAQDLASIDFLDFLASERATSTFRKHGFAAPPRPPAAGQ